MRLLVNGCSFSRGPIAWPNHVARLLNADLVNLAQSGAGNNYIAQTTQAELARCDYDLVLVMWSGLERIDIQVERIEDFDQTLCTSLYQSSQNDWAEKIVEPVNDQDCVQKDWVFGVGYLNGDRFLTSNGLFTKQYMYQSLSQHTQRSMYHMISLQSYCKSRGIPFVATFYQNYVTEFDHFPTLKAQLDWNNIYNQVNLFDLVKQTKDFDTDGLHPGATAYERWAVNLYNFISK